MLGDLLDGEGLIGVRHDGADGLSPGLEAGRPVERLRRGVEALFAVRVELLPEVADRVCMLQVGDLGRDYWRSIPISSSTSLIPNLVITPRSLLLS